MIINMHPVLIHEIPANVTRSEEKAFLQSLKKEMEIERPHLVLDCSRLLKMEREALHLLLSCLEEVLKRNGDVKLAALHPDAKAVLQRIGGRRLFEVYPNAAEAARSFDHAHVNPEPWELGLEAGEYGSRSEPAPFIPRAHAVGANEG